MGRQRKAKRLRQNGYRRPSMTNGANRAKFVKKKGGKNYRPAQFALTEESVATFSDNIAAYIKTMSPENIRPLIEVNANQYIVNRVRPRIPIGKSDHQYGALSKRSKKQRSAFKILRGNLQKSYQVLTHRKKFRADTRVFVGPKAYFRKSSFAAVYGRSPKNSNAFYGPAREARGAVIAPAVRSAIPGYFNANERMIRKMLKP